MGVTALSPVLLIVAGDCIGGVLAIGGVALALFYPR